jgi:hypothetical protein
MLFRELLLALEAGGTAGLKQDEKAPRCSDSQSLTSLSAGRASPCEPVSGGVRVIGSPNVAAFWANASGGGCALRP